MTNNRTREEFSVKLSIILNSPQYNFLCHLHDNLTFSFTVQSYDYT